MRLPAWLARAQVHSADASSSQHSTRLGLAWISRQARPPYKTQLADCCLCAATCRQLDEWLESAMLCERRRRPDATLDLVPCVALAWACQDDDQQPGQSWEGAGRAEESSASLGATGGRNDKGWTSSGVSLSSCCCCKWWLLLLLPRRWRLTRRTRNGERFFLSDFGVWPFPDRSPPP